MSLVFLDTETTGLDFNRHEVWEISYAVEDGPILSSLVPINLMSAADPVALSMNGFWERYRKLETWKDYSKALEFESVLQEALKGNTVVAANPRFDMNMLAARWGVEPWHYRSLDIESYAMGALGYEEPKGLHSIYTDLADFGWNITEPDHSAAGDVKTLRMTYYILRGIYLNAFNDNAN